MFSLSNPLYNTVIVFVSIMGLLYIIKPDAIYDKRKAEFKQFGVDSDKTLLPIYVIGILLAIILYVLFNQLAKITTPDAPAPDPSYAYYAPHAQHGQHIRTEQFDTEHDSELSSLKNQVMMMNHTINQMSQMNQLSQLSHMNHMNQLNQMQYGGRGGQSVQGVQSNIPRRHRGGRSHLSHTSDRSGIYTQSEGSNSASAKSIDADGLVDSVLASVYDPSISYSQSAGTGSVTGSTASIGSSTYDPRSMNGTSSSASAILPNRYSI